MFIPHKIMTKMICVHYTGSYILLANEGSESQTFGDKTCHPERSEGSRSPDAEIFRCAQDDRPDSTHVRSREVFSPNVYYFRVNNPSFPKHIDRESLCQCDPQPCLPAQRLCFCQGIGSDMP